MKIISVREILKVLKNSHVGFLICELDGTIKRCDPETKKRLCEGKKRRKLTGSPLNNFISVIYPHNEPAIPASNSFWIQVWNLHPCKETYENIGVLGIKFTEEPGVQEQVLFLLFPIKDTQYSTWGFRETELTHILQVIELLPLIVLQIDHSGNIYYVNEYIERLTGWLPSEVQGKNWFEIFTPDEIRDETIQFFQIEGKKHDVSSFTFEGEILTKDSKRLLILWACFPLRLSGYGEHVLVMLGQEISTPHRTKFFNKATQLLKKHTSRITDNLIREIPQKDIFNSYLQAILEVLSFEAGAIFKLSGKTANLIVSEGLEPSLVKRLKEIPVDNVIINKILMTQDIKEISPLMKELQIGFHDKGFVKVYGIPIYSGEKALGFVTLATTRKETDEAEVIPLLNMITFNLNWLFLWYDIQEQEMRRGRQYELLERMIPYALISVDETGTIISINKGGLNLLRVENEEKISTSKIYQFIPEWEHYIQVLKSEEVSNVGNTLETDVITINGEKIPAEIVIGHFTLASRSFYMIFLQDIRWKKQVIDTIHTVEEKYREIYENANDILYTHDIEGVITSVNKVGLDIIGYTSEELLHKSIYQVIAPEYIAEVKKRIQQKIEGLPLTKYELEIIAKDGRRIPVEVSTRVVYEKGVPVEIQGIARDISDRKKVEKERQQLEAQILHSQKLESLGVLAGGIAHDVNNILLGILGNAELALTRLPEDSPIRAYLYRIEESTQRIAELTKQMLAYSGRNVVDQRLLNLSQHIEEMAPLLSAIISKKDILEYDLEKDLLPILGDASQIHQILINLVTNASEALGETKGEIKISTAIVDLTTEEMEKEFFLEQVVPGKYVVLTVSDTGCGMTPEILSKIFDPFFTTKFIGRGLGLSAVLGIVRSHRGTLHVDSQPGEGTVFKIYLPIAKMI